MCLCSIFLLYGCFVFYKNRFDYEMKIYDKLHSP